MVKDGSRHWAEGTRLISQYVKEVIMATKNKIEKVYRGVKYLSNKRKATKTTEGVYRGVKWSK